MRDKIGELVTAYNEKRDAALKKQLTVIARFDQRRIEPRLRWSAVASAKAEGGHYCRSTSFSRPNFNGRCGWYSPVGSHATKSRRAGTGGWGPCRR